MKGQGLVEYALILVLVAIVLIVIIAALSPVLQGNPCVRPESFECVDYRVQECVKTEQYTRDECIVLIGGGK